MDILSALGQEEARLRTQLAGIRVAIAALSGNSLAVYPGGAGSGTSSRGKRVVSAALRAHLSRRAKERWARIKARKPQAKKAKS